MSSSIAGLSASQISSPLRTSVARTVKAQGRQITHPAKPTSLFAKIKNVFAQIAKAIKAFFQRFYKRKNNPVKPQNIPASGTTQIAHTNSNARKKSAYTLQFPNVSSNMSAGYTEFLFKEAKLNSSESSNLELALRTVKQRGVGLEHLPDFQDNDEVVNAAVEQDGLALQFASSRLKNNFKTVQIALKQNAKSLSHASIEMQKNEILIQQAIKETQRVKKTPEENLTKTLPIEPLKPLLDEKTSALKAIQQFPLALKHYPNLQDDDEVVLEAIKLNGLALEHASPRLRNTLKFALEAIKQNPKAYAFASPELRTNQLVIDAATRRSK